MHTATTAAVGWSVVLLVAGGIYFVSNQRKNKNKRTATNKVGSRSTESRKEQQLSKKLRKDVGSGSGENVTRQSKKKQNKSLKSKTTKQKQSREEEELHESNNTEQILETAETKELTPTSQPAHKPKPVKQDCYEEKQRCESLENTTGNEADDESAFAGSKQNSTVAAPSFSNGDVSDMLEMPQAHPAACYDKKQRQNRQKAKDAALARSEEEQARKVKLESQRRIARESEGRAPKDGRIFMASQASSASVWKTDSSTGKTESSAPNSIQLLDTFENSSNNTGSTAEPNHSESEETTGANNEVTILSEEEQVQIAIKETGAWSVVKGKEKKSRGNASDDTDPSKFRVTTHAVPISNSPAITSQPLETPRPLPSNRSVPTEETLSEDSEWEVS
ncbi:hypothetical protein BGHDH14_bghG000441000001001 [Blumeria hordei DH14]|uniref:Uncharacterized protein n=1 Tax=Blumeria graminis f. sp. hordei (strain DH14) TaxID=546991 RepID=N1J5D5_BLUG1|nr:hypothetical protein BGHDH14_bghG000441000001001 [Blumeria hordei DH14]